MRVAQGIKCFTKGNELSSRDWDRADHGVINLRGRLGKIGRRGDALAMTGGEAGQLVARGKIPR